MKKYIPAIIIIALSFIRSSAQRPIHELHFPYYNGYTFTLTCETTSYDLDAHRTKGKAFTMHYLVNNHVENKKGRKMNFAVTTFHAIKEKDFFDSWLVLDKKGMKWCVISDTEKIKPTQAVRLPLQQNTKWNSTFNNIKANMTVLSTDTIIKTYKGPVHAFAIRYTQLIESADGLKLYDVMDEYYAQYWGKIGTYQLRYAVADKTGKAYKILEVVCNISDCNLPQEFLDKVPFEKKD